MRHYNVSVDQVTPILASRSARRVRLLQAAGYRFRQVVSPYVEPPLSPEGDAVALAVALAKAKAAALVDRNDFDDHAVVVLAADTIVVGPDGRLMGKPADRATAEAMLARLAGGEHRVVTGVVLTSGCGDRSESFADTAAVRFGRPGRSQLDAHLTGGRWRGKAGGYDLDDMRHHWSATVEGDATTVIGLPMRRLEPVLECWSVPRVDIGVRPCRATGA